MKYHILPPSEKDELGYNGKIIYDLIKEHKHHIFKRLQKEKKLIELIQTWEKEYIEEMISLMDSGLSQSQAREIAWPEITARFGM